MSQLDFDSLNNNLLRSVRDLLPDWLPGGKLQAQEYCVGNLFGAPGDSLRINITTGKWCDFATGDKGGDLISLYAAINNVSQKDAFLQLSGLTENIPSIKSETQLKKNSSDRPKPPETRVKLIYPPKGTPLPEALQHASKVWRYKDIDGHTMFLVARRELPNGKKSFAPWSWSAAGHWIKKSWPEPRPLYNLDKLKNNNKPVIIVEGEKSADAVEKYCEPYIPVTWPNGASSYNKTDWSPLYNRTILIWPDADAAGIKAATSIAAKLLNHVKQIKILDVSDLDKGVDAADFDFDNTEFIRWAKPRAKLIEPVVESTNRAIESKPTQPQPAQPQPIKPEVVPDKQQPSQHPYPAVNNNLYLNDEDTPQNYDPSLVALWMDVGLSLSGTGNPHINVNNVMRVLNNYKPIKNLVWYDEFHFKYFTNWLSDEPREWSDTDDIRLTSYLQEKLGLHRITKQVVHDAVILYAQDRSRNEPLDWLESLKWDQTPRVHSFFHTYFGATDSDYSQAISKNFWISMVARIFKPGCKVDNMVILEGPQGKFKSTALSVIGGPWYVETNENPNSKDFYQIFQGKLIIEIGELDSFNKSETTTIKKVISTATDRFRPPYGKAPKDFPRQCIFVGTTNESHYLKDYTGARRFWPIKAKEINLSQLKKDREQLFAEAVSLYNQGLDWYKVPISALDEQEERRDSDVWEQAVSHYIDGLNEATLIDIALRSLTIPVDRIDKRVQNRLGRVLRALNWEPKKLRKIGGSVKMFWGPIGPNDLFDASSDDSDSEVNNPSEKVNNPNQIKPKMIKNYAPGADNSGISE